MWATAVVTNEIFQLVISLSLVVVFLVQLALLIALYRLVTKAISLIEQVRVKTDPVVEQTRQLLTSAKPVIEKAQATAEAISPILARTNELLGVARETTVLVRDTTATLKTEAEACLAAVTATTRELSRLTTEVPRKSRHLSKPLRNSFGPKWIPMLTSQRGWRCVLMTRPPSFNRMYFVPSVKSRLCWRRSKRFSAFY